MKKAEVLLDLPLDRAKVKGEGSDLETAKGSHYGIDLLPKTKCMEKFEILVAEGAKDDDQNESEDRDSGTGKDNRAKRYF